MGPEANGIQVLAGLICRAWDFKYDPVEFTGDVESMNSMGSCKGFARRELHSAAFRTTYDPFLNHHQKILDAPVTSTSQEYSPPYTQSWDR